ncbi:MAG: aminotransferase class V-fold PLP-dependent enzyme [Cyclobacteriaceae bacterium]
MNRREIVKSLTILPFAGGFLTHDAVLGAPLAKGTLSTLKEGENIYRSIGVEPVINCRGTFTIIGGSIERPEVMKAMEAAGGHFVQYDEMAAGIGRRLAELTKTEWGIVTAGCAAGLKHVTAACVTGGNPEKLIRIPNLAGLEKTEVIIPRHSRNVYDHAVRNVGVTVITVETPEELKQAINPRTAMIYVTTSKASDTGQPFSLEVIAQIAKPKNVPLLVDAAAEDLTIPPVHFQRGATIVAYSGGKAICGPQCAGLILGDKNILMSAWQASSPHHGPGRDNKVGKEEMLGMLAAVEAWTARDHAAEWQTWLSWLEHISKKVSKVKGVSTNINEPTDLNNHAPVLTVSWDPKQLNITGEEVAEEFARKKPRIAVGSRSDDQTTSISVTPNQMQAGEEKVVADRIHKLLSQKRKPRSTKMEAPGVDINGRWEVMVAFFSSKSKHRFFIEQDGNWLQGIHQGDYSNQELVGTVEGNQVKLRSDMRIPGNGITFMFSGTVSGDMMEGSVFLGEYLNAKFTAKRAKYKKELKSVSIPGGPPLES